MGAQNEQDFFGPGAKAVVEKGLPEVRPACARAQAKNRI